MYAVAPSATYDVRFKAAVEADLTAAIFHRTEVVLDEEARAAIRSSSGGSSLPGNSTSGVRVTRGAFFTSFFAVAPDGGAAGCPPPAHGVPLPVRHTAHKAAAASNTDMVVSDTPEHNTVTMLEVRKQFNKQLPLVAVSVSVTTDLFTDPSDAATAMGSSSGSSDAAGGSSAAAEPLSYYVFLPSAVFDAGEVGSFFYNLVRRRQLSVLSSDTLPVFPALTVEAMEAIAREDPAGPQDDDESAPGRAVTRGAHADVFSRSSAAVTAGVSAAAERKVLLLQPPQRSSAASEAQEERDALIRALYGNAKRSGSCRGVSCALGILCVAISLGLIVGAVTPFLCGRCTRRRQERKDEVRLLSHQQLQR